MDADANTQEAISLAADGALSKNQTILRSNPFYDYYQISRGNEDDEAQSGSDDGELKGHWTGLHSPFGFFWSLQQNTGYTDHYLLWEVSLANLRTKLADALKYNKGERVKEVEDFNEIEFKT